MEKCSNFFIPIITARELELFILLQIKKYHEPFKRTTLVQLGLTHHHAKCISGVAEAVCWIR